jgi:hypothetical protein
MIAPAMRVLSVVPSTGSSGSSTTMFSPALPMRAPEQVHEGWEKGSRRPGLKGAWKLACQCLWPRLNKERSLVQRAGKRTATLAFRFDRAWILRLSARQVV